MDTQKENKILRKGFTLVETLVAISILSLSVAATFTAVQSGIQDSTIAKDQITAFYLAQEAMEFIKNKRDENALNSLGGTQVNWLSGMSSVVSGDPCYFGNTCRIDSPASSIDYCGTAWNTCPNLNQDNNEGSPIDFGLFGYNAGWTPTIFKREIQFNEIVPNTEVAVTIRMSWTSRGSTKEFEVTETLFNRQ